MINSYDDYLKARQAVTEYEKTHSPPLFGFNKETTRPLIFTEPVTCFVTPHSTNSKSLLKTKVALVLNIKIYPDDLQKFKETCVHQLPMEFFKQWFDDCYAETIEWAEYLDYVRRFDFFANEDGTAGLYFHLFEMETFGSNFYSIGSFPPVIIPNLSHRKRLNPNQFPLCFSLADLREAHTFMWELVDYCKQTFGIKTEGNIPAYFKVIQTFCEDSNEGEENG